MNVEVTKEEVFDMMSTLYPDQTARCISEVKVNKLAEALEELQNGGTGEG